LQKINEEPTPKSKYDDWYTEKSRKVPIGHFPHDVAKSKLGTNLDKLNPDQLDQQLKDLEHDFLTPLNQRELREFREIEDQNTVQLIYEKKAIVASDMPVQNGLYVRRRSQEISEDEATTTMRAAALRDLGHQANA
jgi:hypothetical protein